jgi:enoyl-[acyl-carrier-protein] reductase (NADH)
MAGLMEGKRVLVTGARNEWSIAWHAALSLHRAVAAPGGSAAGLFCFWRA